MEACETGDPVLDDPTIRAGLTKALELSGADAPDRSARREIGGYIYQTADGTRQLRLHHDPDATPCSMKPGSPKPQAGEMVVGVWHTHPFENMEILPANCRRFPGSRYSNTRRGGGSLADWEFINDPYEGNKLPMYIIDKEEVFRLDPNTPDTARRQNPNRFDWKNTGDCRW